MNIRPLLIIPGPKQPSNVGPYLIGVLTELQILGKKGMKVQIKGTELIHRPLLGGILSDTPARNKVAMWLGQRAYLGCGFCLFQATAKKSEKKNVKGKEYTLLHFKGYTDKVRLTQPPKNTGLR